MVLKTNRDSKSLIIIGPSPQILWQQPSSQTGFVVPTTNIRKSLTKGSQAISFCGSVAPTDNAPNYSAKNREAMRSMKEATPMINHKVRRNELTSTMLEPQLCKHHFPMTLGC